MTKPTYKKTFQDYLGGKIKLNKSQKIGTLFLIVILSGTIGWLHEFVFTFMNEGFDRWYMQGGSFLPWINLYAMGALLIIPLTYKYRSRPLLVFTISFFATGLLELISGWLVFKFGNGARYWDYNNQPWNFGNIGGFVCLLSATAFGIAGLLLMYWLFPFCIYIARITPPRTFLVVTSTIFALIMLDATVNLVLKYAGLPTAMDFYESQGWEYR